MKETLKILGRLGSKFGMNFWLSVLILSAGANVLAETSPGESNILARTFKASGTVKELKPAERTIVIQHEAISNYMAAMTMPFHVREAHELSNLREGDIVSFQLHVTENASWVDQFQKTGFAAPLEKRPDVSAIPSNSRNHPLLDYKFTNELGAPVRLNDFRGQALAITFIFTRCPLPEFCPRLSKNFQEAAQKLTALTNTPTNWHFLSVTFDPEFDTPATLKTYGDTYQYDPAHWSFLTGSAEQIGELAQACGVTYAPNAGTINHNFRTLIIDANSHLQMIFPTSGDLSDAIAHEMVEAAAATNRTAFQAKKE